MILEAHVGWSPLLGWYLRRFQRPVAVVSVVASGVMVIALLVLCLSVAPARADITPGYDPYTHTGGSHSGRTGDKECTPREDFINTVFLYRGSGSRNMQRWLSSVSVTPTSTMGRLLPSSTYISTIARIGTGACTDCHPGTDIRGGRRKTVWVLTILGFRRVIISGSLPVPTRTVIAIWIGASVLRIMTWRSGICTGPPGIRGTWS